MSASSLSSIERSRQLILEAVGNPADVSLVVCGQQVGDQLAAGGARALLGERRYRELDLARLAVARGDTALLLGSGFSRSDHEIMPRALAIAELRFGRVVVLPTSFDPSDEVVYRALSRTGAIVFAAEPDSYRRIADLCDARLAHETSFFFNFSPYRRAGSGVLNAFRSVVEKASITSGVDEDASGARSAFEHWLQHIAAHETVRTDEAPTMIAAALMGKQVEYPADGTLGSEAIARYALTEHQVTPLPPRASIKPLPPAELDECAKATLARLHAASEAPPASTYTVTAVLLTRDRPEFLHRALSSLDRNEARVRTVVLDNNSAPEAAEAVAALCEARHDTVLNRSERNLGCAGGRRLGAEMADSDFVLFLDDDAELVPGALDHLVFELDRHRGTGAVTATVVQSDATVLHSGGSMETDDAMVMFNLLCIGVPFPSPAVPPTGPSGWAPGGALLARRALLREFPFDDSMGGYFEDNEWSYRVEIARPDSFRRSREALVLHHVHRKRQPTLFASRSQVVELLVSYARFYELHGLLLGPWLFYSVPELCAEDGSLDLKAARLLMELVIAKGPDWTFMEWMNGDLDGLLEGHRRLVKLKTLDADVKRLAEDAAHQQEQAAREREEAARERRLFEARAAQDARAIAELDARLHDATRRLRRVEESVTWQLFDRFRKRAVALLGGEKSHTVALLQSVLRWTGRHLPREHRREPFEQPAPDAIGRGHGRRRWRPR